MLIYSYILTSDILLPSLARPCTSSTGFLSRYLSSVVRHSIPPQKPNPKSFSTHFSSVCCLIPPKVSKGNSRHTFFAILLSRSVSPVGWLVGWLAFAMYAWKRSHGPSTPVEKNHTTKQSQDERSESEHGAWLRKFSTVHLLSSNLVLVELPSPPCFSFGRRWQVDESECFQKSISGIGLSCARLFASWDSKIWNCVNAIQLDTCLKQF